MSIRLQMDGADTAHPLYLPHPMAGKVLAECQSRLKCKSYDPPVKLKSIDALAIAATSHAVRRTALQPHQRWHREHSIESLSSVVGRQLDDTTCTTASTSNAVNICKAFHLHASRTLDITTKLRSSYAATSQVTTALMQLHFRLVFQWPPHNTSTS